MIPVTQTKVVVKNSNGDLVVRGNCYAACIASILELPITEVPNVEVFFHMPGGYWHEVMDIFLESKGYELMSDNMFKRFHPDDPTVIPNGFDFRGLTDVPKGDNREFVPAYYKYKDKYYLVTGKSARGVTHTCIYQNGKLVHDPHPTKEGLVTLEHFASIEKTESYLSLKEAIEKNSEQQ